MITFATKEMCVGFLLAGIGQEAQPGIPANFMVVDKGSPKGTLIMSVFIHFTHIQIQTKLIFPII